MIKNRDYERDLNRANQELVNAQSEIKKQEEELKSIKKSYREKLSSLLSVQEEFSSVKLSKNDDVNNENYVSQKEREEEKDPLTDLLISYNNSEEKMLKTLSNSNSQVRQLRENVRCLSDRYRACLDALTEEGEIQGLISQRNMLKFDMILHNVTNNLISSNNLISKRATVLCDGDKDNIWIGTNFGLYQYNPKDSITYFGERNEKLETSISDLYYDTENQMLLVASSSKGIITIKKNQIKQKITKDSGLNSNTCNTIKKIASNSYLIGTNNGLNSLVIKKDNSFEIKNLNVVLGLKNNRIYDINYLDNTVYLATENGLLFFDYQNINSKKTKPKCLIVNLKNQNNTINNNSVFQYSKSDISIEYNGISYINQGNLTYYYKLNGKNDSWSTSTETKINYKSLPAGKYTFSVFCKDGFNLKSVIKTVSFEILPPFWQKTWFILLMILFGAFLIYAFIKYRLNRQKQKFEIEKKNIQIERDKAQLEKQMVELEQKALRLQMNPHFIFNALNTIKGYYSEGDAINASSYISKFSKLLRMLLENTEQIIPLSKEIEMLEIYINLTKIRYKNKFEYELIVDESLNTNEIAIPTLLLQPIVENAIIHGIAPKENKGVLVVRFLHKSNQLECSVEDNGIGRAASKMIQKNKEYQSKALEITRERLALLDTNMGKSTIEIIDLEVDSVPSGTKVIITIPLISIW